MVFVIALGVLILIAVGALIGGLMLRGERPAPAVAEAYLTTLPATPDAWFSEAHLDGTRLVVRIDGGGEGGGEVVVLEAATGRVIGRIALERAP